MNRVIGLGFGLVLAVAVCGLFFLYRDNQDLAASNARTEAAIATLQAALEQKIQEQKKNDERLKEYQLEVNRITEQRDSYRRQIREAMKNDTELSKWADTRLPSYVVDTFKRLREERSTDARSSGKESSANAAAGNASSR